MTHYWDDVLHTRKKVKSNKCIFIVRKNRIESFVRESDEWRTCCRARCSVFLPLFWSRRCVCACLFVRVSLVGSHFISIFHSYSLQLLLIFNWLKMLFGFHFFLRISIAWEFLTTFHPHTKTFLPHAYKNTHIKVYFKSLKFKIPIALHLNQTE